ncbi:hypothetical protein EYC98_19975 [Halieaceae bacterium IMCC14734]|uniref:DUF995 domain-containing protein n=1 Tax=Candidatus Litorirhabdus singularis TaxID=2518993 RepID=A0ABT3TN36_9GAMM|nr:hypothetical protein [Candidatus Litorirhabdus singularis]MCX2983146.1 hypothetical protein [Candidatus Litorirhabdus singularis]
MPNYNSLAQRRKRYLPVLGLVVAVLAVPGKSQNKLAELDGLPVQLSGQEILEAFANVRDDATVQDAAETRAVNYWYADGRFVNRWSNDKDSGSVIGSWRVKGDLRCITIISGLPDRLGQESCNPVFRRGNDYMSFNADGSVHGIHALSALPLVPK